MDNPKKHAIEAMAKMVTAARNLPSGRPPDWMTQAESVIRSNASNPDQVRKATQLVMTSLCRGEWDRSLVELGGLAYLDIFRIPIALLEYCNALELDPDDRRIVEAQLTKECQALQMSKEREQGADGKPPKADQPRHELNPTTRLP